MCGNHSHLGYCKFCGRRVYWVWDTEHGWPHWAPPFESWVDGNAPRASSSNTSAANHSARLRALWGKQGCRAAIVVTGRLTTAPFLHEDRRRSARAGALPAGVLVRRGDDSVATAGTPCDVSIPIRPAKDGRVLRDLGMAKAVPHRQDHLAPFCHRAQRRPVQFGPGPRLAEKSGLSTATP